MSTNALSETVVYPESDGLPMAENTVQYHWITKLVGGLETVFRDDPNVFVAGDLFWYPVEGNNTVVTAPDALVAIGRPRGDRGSYRQWDEGGIAPQVVFEVLSPGNRAGEMRDKLAFYDQHGVEEYYVIDPEPKTESVKGWVRVGQDLVAIAEMEGWRSPRLGIRFETRDFSLYVLGPDGRPFEKYLEVIERAAKSDRRAAKSDRLAKKAARLALLERQRAEAAALRAERLAEKLRALGFDPDA